MCVKVTTATASGRVLLSHTPHIHYGVTKHICRPPRCCYVRRLLCVQPTECVGEPETRLSDSDALIDFAAMPWLQDTHAPLRLGQRHSSFFIHVYNLSP